MYNMRLRRPNQKFTGKIPIPSILGVSNHKVNSDVLNSYGS